VAATFAGDGELPAARLVASIDGVELPVPTGKRVLAADTAQTVAKMMEQTCDDGSATRVFGKNSTVAGKTGTLTKKDPFYIEHSWFVGYAPADEPQIIVSVLLGNAESWHLRGHEAARRLIDRVLKPAKPREKDRKPRSRS
jgi:peptidoglycan glycosyltransferase